MVAHGEYHLCRASKICTVTNWSRGISHTRTFTATVQYQEMVNIGGAILINARCSAAVCVNEGIAVPVRWLFFQEETRRLILGSTLRICSIAMWRTILLALTLASFSLALPAPQQGGANLDQLLTSVFGPGPQSPTTGGPPLTVTQRNSSGDLDSLLAGVFDTTSTTPSVILGTQNNPKPSDDDCECVPYYLCRKGTILNNGIGLIDIRSDFDVDNTTERIQGSPRCPNYLDACCKAPDRTGVDERVTPAPIERKGCGQRHAEGVGFRITGDENNEAQFGEFPWMVAILKEEIIANNQTLNVYQCGGALIHRQAVLTAAHCVQGKAPSELRVRAGEWDTQTKNEIYPHQDRLVQRVVVHESYYAGALYFDYAIVILAEPVTYADNVDVVCLPERNAVFDLDRCFASGWGKDIFGKEGHYQVILKKVELPVVPRDQCQESLRKTRLGKYFNLHETFICAGGEPGKDTCKGDGGSPLVCPSKNNPNTYLQAGIVAWGIGCGKDATPGVYANVAMARDWIDEQMAFYNLDNTAYQA